jgi:hypothetical protein
MFPGSLAKRGTEAHFRGKTQFIAPSGLPIKVTQKKNEVEFKYELLGHLFNSFKFTECKNALTAHVAQRRRAVPQILDLTMNVQRCS